MNTTKKALFALAHEDARAIRAEFPRADYRVTFASALKNRYAMMRAAAAACRDDIAPRAAWDAMDGDAQYTMIRRIVVWCMNRDKAECDCAGNYRPNVFAWIACDDDILCTIDETYTRMEKAFLNAEYAIITGKRDTMPTLRAILANAARSAARYIGMNEYKHIRADRRVAAKDYNDANGTNYMEIDEYGRNRRLTIIDTNDSATGEPIAPSPENALIIRDSIERAAADDTDRTIIDMLIDGETQTAIADAIGMTQKSVSIRIKKIRERYRAADAIDA